MPDVKTAQLRGADIVARTLDAAGLHTIFTLSGNHIMSLFDAALGTRLRLFHVRHEAAAVHMADAWGRLKRQAGIALVTGGPGHTNAVAALVTAQAAESPMVLLSGHVALSEVGRGGFQELRQAEIAAPVTKASWTAADHRGPGRGHRQGGADRHVRAARSGACQPAGRSARRLGRCRQGRVAARRRALRARRRSLSDADADAMFAALAGAERPLILAGPTLCDAPGRALLAGLAAATGVPAIGMEGSARVERHHARRLRRCAQARRPHRAHRQAVRLFHPFWRRAADRSGLPLHRDRSGRGDDRRASRKRRRSAFCLAPSPIPSAPRRSCARARRRNPIGRAPGSTRLRLRPAIVRRRGMDCDRRRTVRCIRLSFAARSRRCWKRIRAPCWCVKAARSANGRRRRCIRRVASSTASPARSEPRSRLAWRRALPIRRRPSSW